MSAWFWDRLASALGDPGDPWRHPVLASSGPDGPEARIVVVRAAQASSGTFVAFCDSRTPKFEQISADGRTSWVFYDPRERVQARVKAFTRAVTGAPAEPWLAGVAEFQRDNYRTRGAPGSIQEGPDSFFNREGPLWFGVLEATVVEMDFLSLEGRGHRRSRVRPGAGGGHWLTP